MTDSSLPELDAPPTADHGAAQFSLRSILVLMLLVGVFCGLIAAQQYFGAYLYTMLVAGGAMSVDIIRNRVHRGGAVALLVIAIAYALCNIAIFAILIAVDPFSIFGIGFMFIAVLAGPAVVIGLVIALILVMPKFHWLTVAGFILWVAGVGFGSFSVIAICSASV